MSNDTKQPDRGPAWAPYEPGPEMPWDLRRVAHLHRRAGFARRGPLLITAIPRA